MFEYNDNIESGECNIVKIEDKKYLCFNEYPIAYASSYDKAEDKLQSREYGLTGSRSRFYINLDNVSILENYKGRIVLYLSDGSVLISDDNADLETLLVDYGFTFPSN